MPFSLFDAIFVSPKQRGIVLVLMQRYTYIHAYTDNGKMIFIHRAVKSCQKTHPCNRCRQQRLTVYTQAYSHVEQGRSCYLCQTQFTGCLHQLHGWVQIFTSFTKVVPWACKLCLAKATGLSLLYMTVHYSWVVHIYAVYIMIQCSFGKTLGLSSDLFIKIFTNFITKFSKVYFLQFNSVMNLTIPDLTLQPVKIS